MSDEPRVIASVVDGVGHLRLNRPKQRNAVDTLTVAEARAAIESFVARDVAAAILEAEGTVFCSGGDRSEAGTPARSSSALVKLISESPLFWAARVQGPAVGGGVALAVCCPLVVCTPEAWFDLPEAQHGFLPTAVLAYLEQVVGPRRALQLSLMPERIAAPRALELGLVDHVVPAEGVDAFLAERLVPLARTPKLLRSAGRAWQARFTSDEFRKRLALLMDLL